MAFYRELLPRVRCAYELLIRAGDMLQSPILLVFRLYWGWQLFVSGRAKLLNHEPVTEYFASLGIPAPGINAWFVGGLECVGGLLLFVGLLSRPTAFLIAANMLVAYLSVEDDRAKLFGILTNPDPFLTADPFFFLLMAVLVLAFGPGKFALDTLLKQRMLRLASRT